MHGTLYETDMPEKSCVGDQTQMPQPENKQEEIAYLYHYTTPEGLKGIVETQQLWVSNIFSLNDWTEFQHGTNIFEEATKRLLAKRETLPTGNRYDIILEVAQGLSLATSPHVYVCCFSDNGNDLGQWRAYCPQGGFSIGFPERCLYAFAVKQYFDMIPCQYEEDPKRALAEMMVKSINELEMTTVDAFRSAVRRAIAYSVPRFKDQAFSQEKETRIVWTPDDDDDFPNDIAFRTRNGCIVPYLKLGLGVCRRIGYL